MAIRILSDQNVSANVIATTAFRLNTDSKWKIRGNTNSTQLAFEYSTSSNLSDSDIKVLIEPNGEVGIGTLTPGTLHGASYGTTMLHIDGGTDRGQLIIEGDSFAGIVLSDNGATANQRVFATSVDDTKYTIKPLNDNGTSTALGVAVTVTHGGNVGINCTNPATKFAVQNTNGGSGIEFSMGASLNYIQSYDRSTSDYIALKFDAEDIRFGTNNGTEAMRIHNTQRVVIGHQPHQLQLIT